MWEKADVSQNFCDGEHQTVLEKNGTGFLHKNINIWHRKVVYIRYITHLNHPQNLVKMW